MNIFIDRLYSQLTFIEISGVSQFADQDLFLTLDPADEKIM